MGGESGAYAPCRAIDLAIGGGPFPEARVGAH
jgi:hypothetical protein